MRWVSGVLYNLEKNYPTEITWKQVSGTTPDLTTGEVTESSISIVFRKAVVLPQDVLVDILGQQDTDIDSQIFLVKRKYFRGYTPHTRDVITINEDDLIVSKAHKYLDCYVLIAKGVNPND
jgi:hypothetical protein